MEVVAFGRHAKELEGGGIVAEADENPERYQYQERVENRAVADGIIEGKQACQSCEDSESAPRAQHGDYWRIGGEASSKQTLVEAGRTLREKNASQTGG